MKRTILDCGYSVVVLKTQEIGKREYPSLQIICPSDASEHSFCPASDASIGGEDNLKALRDLLIKEYPLVVENQ